MENLVYLTVSETDNFTVHILSPWTSDELFQLLIKKKMFYHLAIVDSILEMIT